MFITCEHEPLDTLIPAQTDNRKKHWWHDDRNITFYKIVRTNQDFFSKKVAKISTRLEDWLNSKKRMTLRVFRRRVGNESPVIFKGMCSAIDEKSLFAKQRSGDAFNDPRNPPWLGLDDEDDLSPWNPPAMRYRESVFLNAFYRRTAPEYTTRQTSSLTVDRIAAINNNTPSKRSNELRG